MSVANCKAKLKEYIKESGLDRKIHNDKIDAWANALEKMGFDSENLTSAQKAAAMQGFVDRYEAEVNKKNQAAKLFTIEKSERMLDSAKGNAQKWREEYKAGKKGIVVNDNPDAIGFEAARAAIGGGALRSGFESNIDPEKVRTSTYDRLMSTLNEAVKDVKVEASSGKIDQGFYQALDHLDSGRDLPPNFDESALKYAKAFKVLRDKIFELKQSMNPFLEQAKDYLTKQFHDQEKTAGVSKEEWVRKMLQRAGEKSFPDADPKEKIERFGRIYDHIVDGTWGSQQTDVEFSREAGRLGNTFQRQAAGRSIIFNDWKAAFDHFSDFGPGTVFEGLERVIRSASRDIGTLDKWGPLPDQAKTRFLDRMESTLQGKELQYFQDHRPELDKLFNVSNGSQNAPARGKAAVVTRAALIQQYLAKVGGIFHAMQDPVLAGNLLRQMDGGTIMGHALGVVHEYMKGMMPFGGADYARSQLENLQLFSKAAHAELMNVMGSPGAGPGKVAGILEKMGSLNLYQRHVEAMRAATGTMLSKLLGDHAEVPFNNLSNRMQEGLGRYGIGEHEWDIMRQTGKTEAYGHTLMTPEGIESMSDTAAELYLRKAGLYDGENKPSKQQLDRARFDLARKLGVMVTDHADMGAAQPGTRQKAFLWGDTTINSAEGQLRRLVTQFKTAALVTSDVYRRGYFSGEAPKGDYAGVAQHALLALFVAGIADYAKQLSEGKTPESPANPDFLARAAISSGFAGIFGDSLISAGQRQGMSDKALSLLGTAVGPTFGSLADIGAAGLQAVGQMGGQRQDKTLGPKAVSLLQNNLPLQNLWATKGVMNFYLWNQLKEFTGPGYLGHLQRATGQRAGLLSDRQSYWYGKPTSNNFLGIE